MTNIDQYAGDTISVGDLRKTLEGIDDSVPVYIDVSLLKDNPRYPGYMGNVAEAEFLHASGIGSRCIVIVAHGEKWGY